MSFSESRSAKTRPRSIDSMKSFYVPFLLFLLFAATACNVTKHLPPGETLYAGEKVKVRGTEKKKEAKSLKTELAALVRPKPNTNLLGIRYKLFFYNLGGGDSAKGFIKKFIRNLGEP